VRRLATLTFLAAVFAAAAHAQSNADVINPDRPGIADGSATVSRGVFQIETGAERDDQGPDHSVSTPTLLRYGLTQSLELRVESNGYQHDPAGGSGWSPVSIGFKKHFTDTPSLGVIGRLFVPSGSGAARGDRATGDLRLAADFSLSDKWSINPNVGVAFEDSNGRFTSALAAMTVQYSFTDTFNAFVDGALASPEERHGGAAVLVDTGIAWVIGRNTQLDFSVGWGAHGNTAPDRFWSGGISRAF
jgi:hypothetical protein